DSDVDALKDISITSSARDITDTSVTGNSTATTVDVTVDAVLDQYVAVESDSDTVVEGPITASESTAEQKINLGLSGSLDEAQFTQSLDGGADTDGSESISITITVDSDVVQLSLPASVTTAELTETSSGTWTLTAVGSATAADLVAAIDDIEAVVPAGFEGSITGSISTSATDTASDAEDTTADNTQTDSTTFAIEVGDGTVTPTVATNLDAGDLLI
ncbi:hypothetical protein GUA87_17760, partial [Sneathiella sp. P13V-1]|uniref:hypothetical protein n=1 Tax=Sneathiella sp. P13V-1 TaxID=2697366 RepID=UPI00187B9CFC